MVKQLALFAAGAAFGLMVTGAAGPWAAGPRAAVDVRLADPATHDAVASVKSQVVRAYMDRDAAALERLYGDDFTAIEADGSTRTKVDELASVRKGGEDRLVDGRYDLVAVRRFGDLAVASGRGDLTFRAADGSRRNVRYNSVNVFAYRDGRWVYVAAFLP